MFCSGVLVSQDGILLHVSRNIVKYIIESLPF